MGIVTLGENGYGELAHAGMRSLGETMVSAYYMSLNPGTRAERFEAFTRLEAIKTYRLLERMDGKR